MRIAILGFGTVGQAVARLVLTRHADRVTIAHVFNRGIDRKRAGWMPPHVVWTDDADAVFASAPDVVVELLGGVGPALECVRRALRAGVPVVTANKQIVARHGAELMALARAHGVPLRFEGAVAGGVPVLRAIEDGLAGDRLVGVAGVMNGTSTYVLSRMEENVSFADALAEARALGFAEADPSDDLTGRDAAAKLAILSATALARPIAVDEITCRSIDVIEPIDFRYSAELGCTIRQVAWAQINTKGTKDGLSDTKDTKGGSGNTKDTKEARGTVTAAVRPALVSRRSPLAQVTGSQNVVTVRGEFGGETAFAGRGAGGDATAVAVVSDLLAIQGSQGGISAAASGFHCPPCTVSADYSAPHYVRLVVRDRPGIIAAVADAFARERIGINAVLQHPGWPADRLPFVMTLERCDEARIDRAAAAIAGMDFHVQPPVVLPMFEGAV